MFFSYSFLSLCVCVFMCVYISNLASLHINQMSLWEEFFSLSLSLFILSIHLKLFLYFFSSLFSFLLAFFSHLFFLNQADIQINTPSNWLNFVAKYYCLAKKIGIPADWQKIHTIYKYITLLDSPGNSLDYFSKLFSRFFFPNLYICSYPFSFSRWIHQVFPIMIQLLY